MCGPCPDYGADIGAEPSWGACYDQCTGLDEATCLDTPACRGAYVDICPPNADCDLEGAIAFVECWAVDQTGPIQGECSGLDAWECSRHDDCVAYHIIRCKEEGVSDEEIFETFSVALIVGGSIAIPHLRRGVAFLDELNGETDPP